MKKKILFLVDHKHRDFHSLSLIGFFLEKCGHKVYYRNIHDQDIEIIFPDVIVEAKTSRPKSWIKKIKNWRKKNIKVLVIETEGIHQHKGFLPIKNYIADFYFFWNFNHNYKLKNYEKNNFIVLGSPRTDFFHINFRDLVDKKKILNELGVKKNYKIITIASTNSYQDLEESQIKKIKKRYYEIHKSTATFENLLLYQKQTRIILMNFCKNILKYKKNFYLVVKPHPNENIYVWKNFIEELDLHDKVKLMIGRPIQDLLAISDLHVGITGCSTIAEAGLSKISTIELSTSASLSAKLVDRNHMNLGLYNLKNLRTLEKIFLQILENKIPDKTLSKWKKSINRYSSKYFFKFDGNRCYEYANYLNNYLSNKNNFKKKVSINFLTKLRFSLIKFTKSMYRNLKYFNVKVDHRGRFDNRIQKDDHIKMYKKFVNNKFVKSKVSALNN